VEGISVAWRKGAKAMISLPMKAAEVDESPTPGPAEDRPLRGGGASAPNFCFGGILIGNQGKEGLQSASVDV
jgi:hypothetical protein